MRSFSVVLIWSLCWSAFGAERAAKYVYTYHGASYGVFDPTAPGYKGAQEPVSADDIKANIANLEMLRTIPALREKSMAADPSLKALIDNSSFYSALATRYRYEPLMDGTISAQEPPPSDLFANLVRKNSQTSAMAREVRNRFRIVEQLVGTVSQDLFQPFVMGNLGGAAGDDISAGVLRVSQGQPSHFLTQQIYDIDDEAMGLGEELGQKYYGYAIEAQKFNIIDLTQLPAIAKHLREQKVQWINSIGFFMEYKVEKAAGQWMTAADKEAVFANFCRAGVSRLTFSAFDPTHALPTYIVKNGWKNFDLAWPRQNIIEMMNRVGYELVSDATTAGKEFVVYYFRARAGECH